MSLSSLPSEVLLQILSYLPVSSLDNLYAVSRGWCDFLLLHETTIYRRAAFLHGILHHDSAPLDSVELRKKYSKRILENVYTWKDLCRVRTRVRNAWNAVAPSKMKPKPLMIGHLHERVHRIKVDERRRLIITTTGLDFPRVFVRDMDTNQILWILEPTMGRIYAHLEYSEGFLIFDRNSNEREVWRLADSHLSNTPNAVPCMEKPPDFAPMSQPDAVMEGDSERALSMVLQPISRGPDFWPKGCFEPYALLRSQEETRAYRFVYPTLLTAAHDNAYLWDIPSARVVEVIHGTQRARLTDMSGNDRDVGTNIKGEDETQEDAHLLEDEDEDLEEDMSAEDDVQEDEDMDADPVDMDDELPNYRVPQDLFLLRDVRYVDHSPSHIFLAGQYVLKIFKRAYWMESETEDCGTSTNQGGRAPENQLVLAITSTNLRYGRWRYSIKPGTGNLEGGSSLVRYEVEVSELVAAPDVKLFDQFKAVHVSPCGSHFVVLLCGSRLLIVPHFRDLVGKSEDFVYNRILEVQLSSPLSSKSVYLAYEEGDGGEGKVAVVTTAAVFVLTLPNFPPLNDPTSTPTPPTLRISRVKELMDENGLHNVSCLMLSDTRLFLNFDAAWAAFKPEKRNRLLREWEEEFERSLSDVEKSLDDCFERSREAYFVRELPDRVNFRHESTVYEVNMLPD